MEEKEIEQKLKSSADKIKMKSFSERWENIKERGLIEEEKQEVLAEDTLFATPEGVMTHNVKNKKRYFLIAILSLIISCIVILAITLPLTLKKNEMKFYDSQELERTIVSEEQFFNDIDNAGYEIINLSNFEINLYKILTVNDGKIKGGSVQIANEDIGYFLYITFYDGTVKLNEPILDYKKHKADSIEITYNTQIDEEIFSTYAYAEYNNLHYQIEYISIENNCTFIFEELFN